jgi:hypothetical protein
MFPDLQKVFTLSFLTLGAFGFVNSALFFARIMHRAPWFPVVAPVLVVLCLYVVKLWWTTLRSNFPG